MVRIYTGLGDGGKTDLLGARVSKDDPRVEALGALDETSAAIGMGRALATTATMHETLVQVQRDLYRIMAELAFTPELRPASFSFAPDRVHWLTSEVDAMTGQIELPREFVLPGETVAGSALDVARTVARRAERHVVALANAGHVVNPAIGAYLNRLSSLLFIAARFEDHAAGADPKRAKITLIFVSNAIIERTSLALKQIEEQQRMRMSHLFGRTLREAPGDVELPSHRLMLRAALIRPLGAGIYSLLPLGWRVIRKVEQVIREEMNAIGGQELLMPVVHPADIWRESGRYDQVGPELTRFKDRGERDMVLAMTHEEVVTDLARQEINSYRQLPMLVYHIQTKWRDEPRSRGGLIRVREFTMKDSYSLDRDEAGLDEQYKNHWLAYERIFRRVGLDFVVVGADTGMMGGTASHEFMALSPHGEDIVLICPACGYADNREVATFVRDAPTGEPLLPLTEVETPNTTTIQALADFLDIPLARTAKAVFYKGDTGRFIFAVIRGDLEVNETKLRKAAGELGLTPATVDDIRTIGAEPGFGSPVGVRDALIVIDESVRDTPNLVAGANRAGWHMVHTNPGRDYQPDVVADIAAAEAGFPCPVCGQPLIAERAIEVGNIFKLGSRYSQVLGAEYQDEEGQNHPIVMGSYGIGSGRVSATVVEQHHDDRGIAWPVSVAPYEVSLLWIGAADEGEPQAAADRLYRELTEAGIEVLYDDRPERAGVKFNDSDLIGNPIRVSVSGRTLANGEAEIKLRSETESTFVPLADVVPVVKGTLDNLYAQLTGDPPVAMAAAGLEA